MKDTIRFVREVHCGDEYCDSRPDKAIIVLDRAQVKRILELAREVKRLKVYKIVEFDYSADWRETGVKEPDWSMDCETLNVTKDDFHFDGLIKHTSITLETERVTLADLRKKAGAK